MNQDEFPFTINDIVLANWDNRIYYAKILSINRRAKHCTLLFDDKSVEEVDFSKIYSVDATTAEIVCVICKDGESSAPNEIVLCDECSLGYHQFCHSPSISSIALKPTVPWKCCFCERRLPNPHTTNPFKEGHRKRQARYHELFNAGAYSNESKRTWNKGMTLHNMVPEHASRKSYNFRSEAISHGPELVITNVTGNVSSAERTDTRMAGNQKQQQQQQHAKHQSSIHLFDNRHNADKNFEMQNEQSNEWLRRVTEKGSKQQHQSHSQNSHDDDQERNPASNSSSRSMAKSVNSTFHHDANRSAFVDVATPKISFNRKTEAAKGGNWNTLDQQIYERWATETDRMNREDERNRKDEIDVVSVMQPNEDLTQDEKNQQGRRQQQTPPSYQDNAEYKHRTDSAERVSTDEASSEGNETDQVLIKEQQKHSPKTNDMTDAIHCKHSDYVLSTESKDSNNNLNKSPDVDILEEKVSPSDTNEAAFDSMITRKRLTERISEQEEIVEVFEHHAKAADVKKSQDHHFNTRSEMNERTNYGNSNRYNNGKQSSTEHFSEKAVANMNLKSKKNLQQQADRFELTNEHDTNRTPFRIGLEENKRNLMRIKSDLSNASNHLLSDYKSLQSIASDVVNQQLSSSPRPITSFARQERQDGGKSHFKDACSPSLFHKRRFNDDVASRIESSEPIFSLPGMTLQHKISPGDKRRYNYETKDIMEREDVSLLSQAAQHMKHPRLPSSTWKYPSPQHHLPPQRRPVTVEQMVDTRMERHRNLELPLNGHHDRAARYQSIETPSQGEYSRYLMALKEHHDMQRHSARSNHHDEAMENMEKVMNQKRPHSTGEIPTSVPYSQLKAWENRIKQQMMQNQNHVIPRQLSNPYQNTSILPEKSHRGYPLYAEDAAEADARVKSAPINGFSRRHSTASRELYHQQQQQQHQQIRQQQQQQQLLKHQQQQQQQRLLPSDIIASRLTQQIPVQSPTYNSQPSIPFQTKMNIHREQSRKAQQEQQLALSVQRENPKAAIPTKTCKICPNSAMFLCSGCRSAWYCSHECQLREWDTHKKRCQKL